MGVDNALQAWLLDTLDVPRPKQSLTAAYFPGMNGPAHRP